MLEHRPMQVDVVSGGREADLRVLGLTDGERASRRARATSPAPRDVKTAFKKTTLLRPSDSERVLVVGLGKRDELDAERLRVAAAVAAKQAQRLDVASHRLGAAGELRAGRSCPSPRPRSSRARSSPATASTASTRATRTTRRRRRSTAWRWSPPRAPTPTRSRPRRASPGPRPRRQPRTRAAGPAGERPHPHLPRRPRPGDLDRVRAGLGRGPRPGRDRGGRDGRPGRRLEGHRRRSRR